MKREDIKQLFPLVVSVSDVDFDKSIGTQLLKSALPSELHEDIFWGLSIGNVGGVSIKTEETVNWEGKDVVVPLYLQKDKIKIGILITFTL